MIFVDVSSNSFCDKLQLWPAEINVIHAVEGNQVYMGMRNFQPYNGNANPEAGNHRFYRPCDFLEKSFSLLKFSSSISK
jgi:hypothetical protein